MTIQITHDKGRDEAKGRLGQLIQQLKSQYSSQVEEFTEGWEGYVNAISGKAKGFAVSGTVEVKEGVIDVDLAVPLLLRGFNKKIKTLIEEKVKASLH